MRKQLILIVIIASSALSLTACKSKVDEAPKAVVNQPSEKPAEPAKTEEEKKEEAPPAAAGNTQEIPFNAPPSKIEFIGGHQFEDHHGGFSKWTGTATVNDKKELEKVAFKIDLSTVYTDEDEVNLETYKQNDPSEKPIVQTRLDKHLMDPDFFDVPKFPESTFVSKEIVASPGENGTTHKVTGDMTLHGVTNSITFPVTISSTANSINAKADFSINRFDFGVKYEGKKDRLIRNAVRLIINIDIPIAGGAPAAAPDTAAPAADGGTPK